MHPVQVHDDVEVRGLNSERSQGFKWSPYSVTVLDVQWYRAGIFLQRNSESVT